MDAVSDIAAIFGAGCIAMAIIVSDFEKEPSDKILAVFGWPVVVFSVLMSMTDEEQK